MTYNIKTNKTNRNLSKIRILLHDDVAVAVAVVIVVNAALVEIIVDDFLSFIFPINK